MSDFKIIEDALDRGIYDSDMKRNRWRIWTGLKEAKEALARLQQPDGAKYNISGKDDCDTVKEDWKTVPELVEIAKSTLTQPKVQDGDRVEALNKKLDELNNLLVEAHKKAVEAYGEHAAFHDNSCQAMREGIVRIRELRRDIKAALTQGAGVTAGWQLVPVNATEKMLDVGFDAVMTPNIKYPSQLAQAIYQAMLAAAPKADAGDGWRPIETAPRDGTPFRVRFTTTMRFLPYKKDARRQGYPAGRWQEAGEYGGWNNTRYEPDEWMPTGRL